MKPRTLHQANVIRLIKEGKDAYTIRDLTGGSVSGVHCIARRFDLEVPSPPPKTLTEGTLRPRQEFDKHQGRLRWTPLHVPTRALRAAGMLDGAKLRFTVTDGKIIIEKGTE